MKVIIEPTCHISGAITPPGSKSCTHRALVCGALSKRARILNPLMSRDTRATLNAVEAMGASVDVHVDGGGEVTVQGVAGEPSTPDDIVNAQNSGTTLRLMTAILSLAPKSSVLTGDSSLRRRPNQPLLDAMGELGALAFSTKGDGTAPLVVCGGRRGLVGGECTIAGHISSQFISALLMTCPLAPKDSTIHVEGKMHSRPYVELTIEMLRHSGVHVEVDGDAFFVPSGQQYSLKDYTVPADFSSAGYLIAAACITGCAIELSGLTSTTQADAKIVDIAERMGASLSWRGDTLKIQEGCELVGIEVDCSQTPDLVPTIAAMAAHAKGRTLIKNIAHVRLKETDRIRAMACELAKMGIRCTEGGDFLMVEGGRPRRALVQSWDDHRIAMALAVAGLTCGVEIEGAEAVDVSYPAFFDDLARLGVGVRWQ